MILKHTHFCYVDVGGPLVLTPRELQLRPLKMEPLPYVPNFSIRAWVAGVQSPWNEVVYWGSSSFLCLENQRPSLWREMGLSYCLFNLVRKHHFSFCELFHFLAEYELFSRYWYTGWFIYILIHLSRLSRSCVLTTVNDLSLKSNSCLLISQQDWSLCGNHCTVSLNGNFTWEKRII